MSGFCGWNRWPYQTQRPEREPQLVFSSAFKRVGLLKISGSRMGILILQELLLRSRAPGYCFWKRLDSASTHLELENSGVPNWSRGSWIRNSKIWSGFCLVPKYRASFSMFFTMQRSSWKIFDLEAIFNYSTFVLFFKRFWKILQNSFLKIGSEQAGQGKEWKMTGKKWKTAAAVFYALSFWNWVFWKGRLIISR